MSFNDSFKKKVTNKLFTYKSYVLHDLAFNNPPGLMCHEILTNQPAFKN